MTGGKIVTQNVGDRNSLKHRNGRNSTAKTHKAMTQSPMTLFDFLFAYQWCHEAWCVLAWPQVSFHPSSYHPSFSHYDSTGIYLLLSLRCARICYREVDHEQKNWCLPHKVKTMFCNGVGDTKTPKAHNKLGNGCRCFGAEWRGSTLIVTDDTVLFGSFYQLGLESRACARIVSRETRLAARIIAAFPCENARLWKSRRCRWK